MNKFSAIGALQLSAAQLIIGFNLVLAKALLPHLSVFIILLLRFGFATIISVMWNVRGNSTLFQTIDGNKFTRTDHLYLFLQAITAGFLFNVFIMLGMQYTSAATAGLITSIIPAAIAGLAVIFLKEHMNINRLISIILAICGLIVLNIHGVSIGFDKKNLIGQFIILLSVFPEALFTIIAKMHRTNISLFNRIVYMNFCNFILFVPFGIWYLVKYGLPILHLSDWLATLLYGCNTILFFVFWYKGLKQTTAIVSGIYTAIAPCATILLAYLFLGEPVYTSYIITFFLIFLSIIIGSEVLKRKVQVF